MLTREIRSAVALIGVVTLVGCATQPQRPSFLARSMQDCVNGDQSACAMLGSLSVISIKVDETNIEPRPRTQSQKDADAIMDGMRRTRSSPTVPTLKISPTTNDAS